MVQVKGKSVSGVPSHKWDIYIMPLPKAQGPSYKTKLKDYQNRRLRKIKVKQYLIDMTGLVT